jgi:hypothetical protein
LSRNSKKKSGRKNPEEKIRKKINLEKNKSEKKSGRKNPEKIKSRKIL